LADLFAQFKAYAIQNGYDEADTFQWVFDRGYDFEGLSSDLETFAEWLASLFIAQFGESGGITFEQEVDFYNYDYNLIIASIRKTIGDFEYNITVHELLIRKGVIASCPEDFDTRVQKFIEETFARVSNLLSHTENSQNRRGNPLNIKDFGTKLREHLTDSLEGRELTIPDLKDFYNDYLRSGKTFAEWAATMQKAE